MVKLGEPPVINKIHQDFPLWKIHAIRIHMWPDLHNSTMWVQIMPSYIFANIFHSEYSIPHVLKLQKKTH